MWQYLVNVVLGLVLIVTTLGALGLGVLMPLLAWTFGFVGVAVTVLSIWGVLDGLARQPHLDHGVESNVA